MELKNPPNRDKAWDLLAEYTKSGSLRTHALAVEAAMRAYASKYCEDEEKWGMCGLLHDFDYEKYPTKEGHPWAGSKILKEKGYPDDVIEAILGHADYTGVPRRSLMAKCLFAVDELSGFLVALAKVRPGKFESMTPDSVERNLKKKGFAEKISRDDIDRGIRELGADRVEHFNLAIQALKNASKELGF